MIRSLRRHLTYANVMASAAVFIALSGGTYAAVRGVPGKDGRIHGCVNQRGVLRVVAEKKKCARGEQRIAWSQKGPAGTAGRPGAQGPAGTPGPQGPQGDACLPSDPACVGPKGDKGDACSPTDPACRGPQGNPGTPGTPGEPGSDAGSVVLGRVNGISGSASLYGSPSGTSTANANFANVDMAWADATTGVDDFTAEFPVAPGSGQSRTIKLWADPIGSIAPSVIFECSVSGSSTACEDSLASGDIVANGTGVYIEVTGSAGAAASPVKFGFRATET
jgi:hypothetical protein